MSETIDAAAKALRVARLLASRPVLGVSNLEVAKALGITASNVTRLLSTLVAEGWALKGEDGRYTPTIQFLAMNAACSAELERTMARTTEIRQRIGAAANQRG